MKRTRKNNSRADWWEARQMPHQRHPQGLGAEGRQPSQHNQLTQFDGSSDNVAYDESGNATKMVPDKTGAWGEYYNLKWDGWNRLVEMKDSASAVVATYAYDGLTRRITKTIGTEVTHFYYNDEWRPVEERKDASTDAERQYVWGIQFRNDLILRDRDTNGDGTLDERLYATHDALGSCTATLNTSGALQERYGYTAFGVRRIMQADFSSRASTSFAWNFGFQGEFLDDESGYVNYGFRYYSPRLGRWLSRDPIEEDGGDNLYLFVGNNGVNEVDYLGMYPYGKSCNSSNKDATVTEVTRQGCWTAKTKPVTIPIGGKGWFKWITFKPKIPLPAIRGTQPVIITWQCQCISPGKYDWVETGRTPTGPCVP